MINYIIQIILFQVLFLAVYDFFLQKETFFKWNRLYLVGTSILSFIIPLLKFEKITKTVSQEYVILLPEVILNPQAVIEQIPNSTATLNYLNLLFYIGLGIFLLIFLVKLYKIIGLIISNRVVKKENYTLILLDYQQSAFSFFHYIFINKSLAEKEDLQIIQHELVHCRQLHSVDLLFYELLKIIMWFNPMVYIYQKRITVLHEYISDAEVVKETNQKQYFNTLLSETFNVENISFVNQFYKHSLIKKRIIMITKNKSQKIKQLKYLVLIPVLFSMLFYVSCTDEEMQVMNEAVEMSQDETITEGKYMRLENGIVRFIGKSLKGTIIPFEEYTEEEKKFYKKATEVTAQNSRKGVPFAEFKVVINEEGERVQFIKLNFNGADGLSSPKPKHYSEAELEKIEDVSFSVVEEIPVFPGCEGTREEKSDCLNRSIQKFIVKNFNIGESKGLGLEPGKTKIYVQFKITKEGEVEIVGARAPHPNLQEEAKRVVNLLPKMEAGSHQGKKVNVTYMLPITFNIE